MRAALGAVRGIDELAGVVGPQVFFDADDVRDDLARLLDDDRVADADVLAGDLLGVVQADAADRRAGDLHRLQVGRGREGAALADGDEDVVDARGRFVLLELVGDEPARRLAGGAEPLALVEAVDLEHEAVDFEVELVQPADERLAVGDGGGEVVEALRRAAWAGSPSCRPACRNSQCESRRQALGVADAVAEEPQPALGGELRVEQLDAAGGRVAGVGVELPARRPAGGR